VVFLASDDSRHIAGSELLVDGSLGSNNVPLGRLGTPDEIAKAVVFLASDDSRHITGMELFVGAGFAQLSAGAVSALPSARESREAHSDGKDRQK
jgi:NAD(P)-dependent dehydrogenase (short-subunit alcohol dehydrogenase family)